WEAVGVTCREGSSIGARAVCVAPVTIGRWAMVAAGSVVVKDVPDFALVAGVPARRLRWVGRAGVPLVPGGSPHTWVCPETGETYIEHDDETLTEAAE
ncbi:MAG TPA: N-acetyltransferase, partial [Phycicoccus sp.]